VITPHCQGLVRLISPAPALQPSSLLARADEVIESSAVTRLARPVERPADAGSLEPEKRRPIGRRLALPELAAPPAARPRLAHRSGTEDAIASLPRSSRRAQPLRLPVESRVGENKPRPFTLPAGLRPSYLAGRFTTERALKGLNASVPCGIEVGVVQARLLREGRDDLDAFPWDNARCGALGRWSY
jgi:hypothetical protein